MLVVGEVIASRNAVTVEPAGSHWEKNANAGGSSGGETAPPEDALPSTTTNRNVGRIAQRPIKTAISEVNEAAARRLSANSQMLTRLPAITFTD